MEDVRDDHHTVFEPFFSDAVRVIELDRKRNASPRSHLGNCRPRENAPTRVAACRRIP